jgi:hypothetical protein
VSGNSSPGSFDDTGDEAEDRREFLATEESAGATINRARAVHGGPIVQAGRIGEVTVGHQTPHHHGPLDDVTDALAVAMRIQWEYAAHDRRLLQPAPLPIRWRRCREQVAGSLSAAGLSRTDYDAPLAPLPGLTSVTPQLLQGGDQRALHRIYGGLPHGRLLIVGAAGTGKSSAAVLLLLDALRYREQATRHDRQRIPVPVMFTFAGWDPDTTPVHEWLITKLATDIPMFHSRHGTTRAAELLHNGRIAVFLDGLDEVPEHLRPRVLQALSEQATYRLIVTARPHELTAAAAQHTLIGAVALELLPLRHVDAADYLRSPLTDPAPPAWRALTATLTDSPASPIAQALTTPLAISLLRDVYPPTAPVDELLDTALFPRPDMITDHLLDHAITAAYARRPGRPPPRYSADTAHRALTLIAHHLTQHRTRDFAWWAIPTWMPRARRLLLTSLPTTLVVGLAAGLGYGPVGGLGLGLAAGSAVGLVVITGFGQRARLAFGFAVGLALGLAVVLTLGLAAGIAIGLAAAFTVGLAGVATPGSVRRIRWRRPRTLRELKIGLGFGLVVVAGFGFVVGAGIGPAAGLIAGLAAAPTLGPVAWLAAILVSGPCDDLATSTEPTSPPSLWRNHLTICLALELLFAPALGLAGLASAVSIRLVHGTTIAPASIASVLSITLVVGLSTVVVLALVAPLGQAVIAQIYLAARHRIPLRLMRFVEDARSRHLLRTVGPIYQFRHATLQDRLARQLHRKSDT